MTRLTRMIGLLSMIAALAAIPAAANAPDNNATGGTGPGGCHATDKDGNDIPLDDGQTVFVDGKLMTCHSGTVVITTAQMTTGSTKKPPKRVITVKKVKTVSAAQARG